MFGSLTRSGDNDLTTTSSFMESDAKTLPITVDDNVTTGQSSDYLFQSANIAIGFIGTLSNGFVVIVLVCSWQQKSKQVTNILILNQLSLDLFSCIWLTATYIVKLSHLWLSGSLGFWLCGFVVSECILWIGIEGSALNLAAIAVERYLKICYPLWHKAHFRSWMAYLTVSVVWFTSAVVSPASVFPTSGVVDGQCLTQILFRSATGQFTFGIWFYLSYYVIPIVIFAVCYSRIFVVMRHQQKVFPGSVNHVHVFSETSQQKNSHLKLLKTSFLLTLSFAICWFPCQTYFLLMNLQLPTLNLTTDTWYVTLLFAFFNICTNPFIYGAKSDVVKNFIRHQLNRSLIQYRSWHGRDANNHRQPNSLPNTTISGFNVRY